MIMAAGVALTLFAAQAAVPPPANGGVATAASEPVVPKDLRRAARTRDELKWARQILAGYPSEASRNGLEGSVAVSVVVTPEGRASECKVTQSSGHSILDEAACKAMPRHSRFTPALNANGAPSTGSYSLRISYYNQ